MNDFLAARGNAPEHHSIDALVTEHGAWRVLLRALRALVLPPRARPAASVDALNDRLRRDIGLPPLGPAPGDWRDLR